jgi:hypothetical protein
MHRLLVLVLWRVLETRSHIYKQHSIIYTFVYVRTNCPAYSSRENWNVKSLTFDSFNRVQP